ncbi:MAG: four helix bundle protein [Parcubacteria group bacterium]|jgi:four helix bundle protein
MNHRYEKLTVWQKSMDLVEVIYCVTQKFPLNEQYGLSAQMRRCAVSIPSNIAEGSRRNSNKDFHHFVTMAFGSGAELETQLHISRRLHYIEEVDFQNTIRQITEVMKMINKFRSGLK